MTDLAAYDLFASALAGRRVVLERTSDERGYTDGTHIYLPGAVPASATIAAQALLLAAGSLERSVVAQLAGRRVLRSRYLTLEVARAVKLLGPAVPPWLALRVHELYDGSIPASPAESLAMAATHRTRVPEAPDWLGSIRPLKLRGNACDAQPPTDDDLEGRSQRVEAPRRLDEEEDEDSERSRILELFASPLAMNNPLSRLMQDLLGAGRSRQPGGGGGEELPVGSEEAAPVGASGRLMKVPARIAAVVAGERVSGTRYPEWDYRRRAYRPDWCTVTEYDPPASGDEVPLPAPDLVLRRELARLGLGHERHRRQQEGDSLDVTALVDAVVASAASPVADDRVYEQRRRTARDLGVLVLLDASGSTGEVTDNAKVFDAQRRLVAQLTAALDELGDRVAAFAFHSQGRESVRFVRIKDFDDRYDRAAQRRLQLLQPAGFTRLGAAIRHGAHMLTEKAGTSNLLLALVGDGLPYEDRYEDRYAQEDSRRALSEAVGIGVGCACVSVGSSVGDEVIGRVWGHVDHRRLERPEQLAFHIRALYRAALTAAAASRRRTHPGEPNERRVA